MMNVLVQGKSNPALKQDIQYGVSFLVCVWYEDKARTNTESHHSVLPRHAVDVGVRTARFDINTLFFKCH